MRVFASVFLFGVAAIAAATPIIYSEQVIATGTIGTSAFTNASLTLTFVGDTANVTETPLHPGYFSIAATGTTINIDGVGSGLVTEPGIEVFSIPFVGMHMLLPGPALGSAGFRSTNTGGILETWDSAFNPYDLTTAIGPIANYPTLLTIIEISPPPNFATTLGTLNIASVGVSTFTATGGVPEPMSSGLVALGLVALGLALVLRSGFKRI